MLRYRTRITRVRYSKLCTLNDVVSQSIDYDAWVITMTFNDFWMNEPLDVNCYDSIQKQLPTHVMLMMNIMRECTAMSCSHVVKRVILP